MPEQPVEMREPGRQQGGLPCPVCKVDLVMADRQGIEIDYCPKCRGVWLDRGELDKIIERSMGQAPVAAQDRRAEPMAPAQPGRDDYYGGGQGGYGGGYGGGHGGGHGSSSHGGGHGQGGYRRRKSWLGELFD